ncbi:MAG: phosphatidylglycerophosphatase A [Fibrobacterota bacterium]
MMKRILYFIGTFAYSGRSPFAPGTAGSLAALLLLLLCAGLLPAPVYAPVLSLGIVLFIAIGIPAAAYIEKNEGRTDPGLVVIDEAAGQWITFLFIPGNMLLSHPWLPVAGFLLFRLFDIFKPFPCRNAERLGGGLGIVLDDVIAGLYASVVLNLCFRFFL